MWYCFDPWPRMYACPNMHTLVPSLPPPVHQPCLVVGNCPLTNLTTPLTILPHAWGRLNVYPTLFPHSGHNFTVIFLITTFCYTNSKCVRIVWTRIAIQLKTRTSEYYNNHLTSPKFCWNVANLRRHLKISILISARVVVEAGTSKNKTETWVAKTKTETEAI